jgi:hypothetical protein
MRRPRLDRRTARAAPAGALVAILSMARSYPHAPSPAPRPSPPAPMAATPATGWEGRGRPVCRVRGISWRWTRVRIGWWIDRETERAADEHADAGAGGCREQAHDGEHQAANGEPPPSTVPMPLGDCSGRAVLQHLCSPPAAPAPNGARSRDRTRNRVCGCGPWGETTALHTRNGRIGGASVPPAFAPGPAHGPQSRARSAERPPSCTGRYRWAR